MPANGSRISLSRAVEYVLVQGQKREEMLTVSVPFHYSLRETAAEKLKEALQEVMVCDIHIPVILKAETSFSKDTLQ